MIKREWGVESNGKLPNLSFPSKTAACLPEFAEEDLPLSRTANLVPEFAVKDLPLGRILMMMIVLQLRKNSGKTLNQDRRLNLNPLVEK